MIIAKFEVKTRSFTSRPFIKTFKNDKAFLKYFGSLPGSARADSYLFKFKGKTYAQKKEYLRALAENLPALDAVNRGGEWYPEALKHFIKYGAKKYGLLTEFRAAGLIE